MKESGENKLPLNASLVAAEDRFSSLRWAGESDNGAQASRRKRNSLLAMATLAIAGLTAHGAEAAKAPNNGAKDAPAPDAKATPAAEDGQATPAQTVHNFNIPAGNLSDVLAEFEKDTGISFALTSENIGTLASPGVTGVLTAQEALAKVLANTGVSARFTTPDRVALSVTGNTASVQVNAEILPSPKYTAPLVDLPQTITVISQSTMQSTASTSLVEALRTVPGITFGAGEGGNPIGDRPFIRGMDAQSSTYIDGMRDIGSQSREVFDVDSIEVQEGPGGAYGGRGTGGGSINMNSKLARRDNFIAGSFTPGTANYKRGTFDANAKFNSLLSGRLTGVWHDADVAGRDGVHTGRWGVAPSLGIGLGGATRAYLDYYHLVTDNIPDSGIPYNNPSRVPTVDPGPQLYQPGDGEPWKLAHRGTFYGVLDRDHDRETAKTATARVERDLWNEGSLLRNSFRYERTSQDYVVTLPDDSQGNILYGLLFRRINSRFTTVFSAINQTDLSGQFKTGKVHHSYATGMEFSQERGNNESFTNNSQMLPDGTTVGETCPAGAGAASGYNCTTLIDPDMHDPWFDFGTLARNHNPSHNKTVTKSVYGFDTIAFNKHFQSTLGLRYDNYDSSSETAANATTGERTTYSTTNNLLNYMASVVYKPDHATSVYGTVSTASIPPGNSLAQGRDDSSLNSEISANIQPETIREEEFGAKREFANGKALARVDFFREDIDNVRITQEDGTVAAAGKDRTLGAGIGVSGQITSRWDFTGGYTYMDATLVSAGGAGTANGLTDGNAMPNTPRHSMSITSNYRILKQLRAGGGIYGMTKLWGNQAQNKWVPGYVREDVFANYEFNKHLNLQLNILNVGDKYYYQQAYTTHYATPAPGRTALFGINVRY